MLAAEHLRWLSERLDEGLELDERARESWLQGLQAQVDPQLLTTLRELLAKRARRETADLLQPGPAFAPPDEGAQPGDAVGPYRLLKLLGSGGMGGVWLAERSDGSLKRRVALKLPHLSWAPGLAARFERERDILATLEHPHIARLYDAGLDDRGRPYMALEVVEGEPIDVWCRQRALPPAARLRLLLQVADAVAYAHGRLVLHRDLKPGNILVTGEGQVRLLDFGIAKLMQADGAAETALTQASGRALTLDYASPEQIRGETLGTASDVYSLGVVAFELLAGARPYRLKRGSAAELEEAITGQDVPLASAVAADPALRRALRGDLDAILNRALKKRVAERYATVDALAGDWRAHLEGGRVAARPDSLLYRTARLARRHRLPLAAGAVATAAFVLALGFGATALVVGVLLLGLGAALWQARRAQVQAHRAEQASRRAQAVQGFVLDIFKANAARQKDPAKARATSARELLDLGAERLAGALHDAPEARAEVMRTLGEMYYELELDEQAADFDRQRLELLRRIGVRDARLVEALVRLAGSLHATGQREQILPALDEARAILDALGDTGSPLRAELLVRLAQRHYNLSLAQAVDYGRQAIALLQAQPVVDHDLLATALILTARACNPLGELAEAERLNRAAIEHVLQLAALPHFDLMTARMQLAEVLAQRQRPEAAVAVAQQACEEAAAALGGDAPGVIIARSRLAQWLHQAGRRDAAHTLARQARDDVLRVKGADDTMYTPIVRTCLARLLMVEARWAEAEAALAPVVAVYRQHYAGSNLLGQVLRLHSAIALGLGRVDEARGLLAEAAVLQQAGAGLGVRPWRLNRLHLDQARIELAAGAPAAALQALDHVVAWPREECEVPHPEASECEQLREQVRRALEGPPQG